ncbi:ADP-ribosylation [Karstenula rhodostoma CBS 690.94]|uniref:ADP-ribosylation n=1 Tax=Karstenula rhodostoma CBS 690.94 TaxID=1392251 RepID=A0A9P4PRW4_9PLEO|nr:ADP-ribosylation [Karstenula rhodostoma CBS 690.94]
MMWKAPFVFLGFLAAFGNTAPLAPLEGDFEDVGNVTSHHFEERANLNQHVIYVWRADRRSPSALKAARGFTTKGTHNGLLEDLSLYRHCLGGKDGASVDNDGFVSTTWKYSVAEGWVTKHHGGNAYIYRIATDEGLIDVEATLKGYSPFPHELEFAAIDKIPWEQVQGWHRFVSDGKGGAFEQPYQRNPDFSQSMYGGQPHGGAQFPLSGFPRNHPAWSKLPWARYAHCKPRAPSKRAEEIFANQSPSGLDIDIDDAVDVATAAPLEARARSRGSRTSRKRPSTAGRRKKTTKKTAKKPKKKPTSGTKTCTAAMKKAGKCKTTAKCTAAMKKAGKCPVKATCTAAEKKKNGGKCPAKSTCTAAEKKKNGGKCPAKAATCTPGEKKANGGVCPKCTAAEKKANGGVCPVCTPAEKKKNGGKCPAKKGDCGPSVSNKARYQEYLRALKKKKAGKKMVWSEGSTGTKGGKGTKTGGKTGA